MNAQKPEDVHRCFEKALSDNDIEAMLAIYEPDAVMVPEVGKTIQGSDAIREHLSEMLAMNPRLDSETTFAVQSGDIALLRARWTMVMVTPGGEAEVTGESTEVVRQQADGTWKCVIDNPYSA